MSTLNSILTDMKRSRTQKKAELAKLDKGIAEFEALLSTKPQPAKVAGGG